MTYVALLRGINVGGNRKVEMAKLKLAFEGLGLTNVKTFINSGNVIFITGEPDEAKLTKQIEQAIEHDFGFAVNTLLRNVDEMAKLLKTVPDDWVNDSVMKCDVIFLWKGIDNPSILEHIPPQPEFENVLYVPGAIVWRIERYKIKPGDGIKIVGVDIRGQLTVRNVNSVRKIYALMQAATKE